MSTIQSVSQSLRPDGMVSLFRLDTTSIGGPVLHFVQSSFEGEPVLYDGVEYLPTDVEFNGLETSGVGALPRPRLRLSNANGVWRGIVNTYGDLLGCMVYRFRTHERFLDGQPEADPLAYRGPDVFLIERKASENSVFTEWELSASIDQEGKMLPGRQIIRNTCLFRYRAYQANSGTFDYSRAICPYAGDRYYDINDIEVFSPAEDVPSRRLSCCRKRFGNNNPLPFGGFPGAGRVRA